MEIFEFGTDAFGAMVLFVGGVVTVAVDFALYLRRNR